LCLSASLLVFAGSLRADEPKEAKGTWIPTAMTLGGMPLPEENVKGTKLTIGDGKYLVETPNEGKDSGTYKVDDAKKPVQLEITSTDGANKGKKFLAIMELKGDDMKICYDFTGKAYPTEFKSTKENGYLVIVYKRQK
jgi:uncharacterized protein (TIGR03067 family)